jgi:N-acetylneuraminic acid mutarotase
MSSRGAPDSAYWAFWTGKEMVVLGLACSTAACYPLVVNGARYHPQSDTWSPISALGAPYAPFFPVFPGSFGPSVAWTGKEVMFWGGVSFLPPFTSYPGARYDPARDVWTPVSTINAPSARSAPVMVAGAGKVIVWGGSSPQLGLLRDGEVYDPDTDSWTHIASLFTSPTSAPPITAWTGKMMLVWMGGVGYRYDPSADAWSAMSSSGAPSPPLMDSYGGVWTGQELFIWGGQIPGTIGASNKGWRYDPESDSWRSVSNLNAAILGYSGFSIVWTGNRVILWGGNGFGGNVGHRYDPATDTWSITSSNDAPLNRFQHSAVWTGNEMLIWGGGNFLGSDYPTGAGARYDPGMDVWHPMSSVKVRHHSLLVSPGSPT